MAGSDNVTYTPLTKDPTKVGNMIMHIDNKGNVKYERIGIEVQKIDPQKRSK